MQHGWKRWNLEGVEALSLQLNKPLWLHVRNLNLAVQGFSLVLEAGR